MAGYGDQPHVRMGDQLWLWDGEPWEGVAPRALTAVAFGLFLRQKPPRHEVFFDPEQLELWPVDGATQREGSRRVSPGAPLLVDLKRTRKGRRLLIREVYDG